MTRAEELAAIDEAMRGGKCVVYKCPPVPSPDLGHVRQLGAPYIAPVPMGDGATPFFSGGYRVCPKLGAE